ncbi:hypothetical protein PVAP13_9KG649200 [Panicum virgatum]|uniref:Protein CutA, chloroplastic n=1 Tax=Panicum virgatum TaxID=38727 RepID=A0A8T0NZS9_PANVG|nr:hypothetical protein PVAP13_9KG649200 [Panicum virgatum]
MPLPAPFRVFSPPSAAAASAGPAGAQRALIYGRRAPLAGALLFFSIGAVSAAVACRTGCSLSPRRLPFLGARGLSSARMESASTTVPSIVVYVTVPNREAGIESVYWWEGKVQSDAEELLIIKTRESLLDALTEHVKANHEYDVPEVISLPITGGNSKYLEWIKNSTREN